MNTKQNYTWFYKKRNNNSNNNNNSKKITQRHNIMEPPIFCMNMRGKSSETWVEQIKSICFLYYMQIPITRRVA